MPKTDNTFYKVLIGNTRHEIIPYRTTDGNNLGSLPSILNDSNLCVEGNGSTIPPIPDTGEQFCLISIVKSDGTVEYKWVLR